MSSLLIDKHEKFFNRCLTALPSSVQSEDSNKLAIIYFCLHGLGLLKRLQFSTSERDFFINNIYNDFLIEKDEFTAFRATWWFKNVPEFDYPNLSATFFGLASLLALEEDYSKKLNRHKILKFVSLCQVKSGPNKGSFVPTLTNKDGKNDDTNQFEGQFGETDLRLCYIAVCIRKLLKYDTCDPVNDIDEQALIEFVLSRINYNGGMSSRSKDESHLGLTFVGIACLRLLNYDLTQPIFQKTTNWLVHRHVDYPPSLYTQEYTYYVEEDIGGFNGRENKFSDTCYSWWCTGSLEMLDLENLKLLDLKSAQKYLLQHTQSALMGGFGKDPDSTPDPFHSFLGIACFSLWNKHQAEEDRVDLDSIDPTMVISQCLSLFLSEHVNFD